MKSVHFSWHGRAAESATATSNWFVSYNWAIAGLASMVYRLLKFFQQSMYTEILDWDANVLLFTLHKINRSVLI